jgi:hypothetical protein
VTDTDLREAFRAVADAVPVPPVDRVAVERRVRRARARRRTALVGVAAASAVVAGLALRPHAAEAPVATAPAATSVPVLVDGELASVDSAGAIERTGLRIAHLVGISQGAVVGFSGDGDLVRVRGEEVVRITDQPVRVAYPAGPGIAYQTYDGEVAWSGPGTPERLAWSYAGIGRLMAASAEDVVGGTDRGLTLHTPESAVRLDRTVEPASRVELAGDTVAVVDGTTRFFSLDGTVRANAAATGSLSADGSTWAGADGVLTDTATGATTRVPGSAGSAADGVATWWADAATFWLVRDAGTARTLSLCATSCTEVYRDPTGTLQLPGQSVQE